MPNISEQIADALLRHSINLQRLDAGMRRKIIGIINGLGQQYVRDLQRYDPTSVERFAYRNRRTGQYLQTSAATTTKAYEEMERVLNKDLKEMANLEAQVTADIVNSSLKVELVNGALNSDVLNSLVLGTQLLNGERLHDWMLAERAYTNRILKQVVNEGVLLGSSVQDMTRKIVGTRAAGYKDGIMRIARNRASTIVRTSTNAIANKTRETVFQNNTDVIKGQQWLATLDTRTSDTCIALDGQAWDMNYEPIEGSTAVWRGPPPAHPNCRSTLVPITKSWSELNKNPAIQKKLEKAEAKIKPSTRANIDGKKVPANMTYEKWLKQQSKARQLEVLGPTKYRLWKANQLSLTDLIDQSHRPLTVAQLVQDYAMPKHKFTSAEDWYNTYAQKNLKPDDILEKFDPSVYDKMAAIQERIKATTPTYDRYYDQATKTWDPQRVKETHIPIIRKFLNDKSIKAATPRPGEKPKYVMFGGRGGSGKGSFTRAKSKGGLDVIDKDKYIVLDADEIKQLLPEYEGWNAFSLHEESSYLFDKISDIAREWDLNIVHDMTLKTGKTAINRALEFKEAGYSIDGYYMFLPPQDAASRAVSRFLGPTQRYVPPEVVLSNTANEANFDALMKYFDKWEFYDNQGAFPVKISGS